MFDENGVRNLLRERCATCSQKEFAEQHGVSLQYVHDVLNGRRMPGASMLNALGLRKRVIYEFDRSKLKVARAFPGVKVRVE